MDTLFDHFGKVLSVGDIAAYFDISEKTVCRNYESLGGIRLSPGGKIIFFEKTLYHAINQKIKDKKLLSSIPEGVLVEDRHNLLV